MKLTTLFVVVLALLTVYAGTVFADELNKLGDIDFGPYMAELQGQIKKAWHPPKQYESKRVVVTFKVESSGHISNFRIYRTSGIPQADAAARAAVDAVSPAPLPPGSPSAVDIMFTFDYNVFKTRRSSFGEQQLAWNMPPTYELVKELTWDEAMEAGRKAFDEGNYELASGQFHYATKLAEQEKPKSVHLAKSLGSLSDVAARQGNNDEAVSLLKDSLITLESSVGSIHPEVANVFEKLALLYSQDSSTDAEYYFKRCISVRDKSLGPKSIPLATARTKLASFYNKSGRNADATTLLKTTLTEVDNAASSDNELNKLWQELIVSLKATNQTDANQIEALLTRLRNSRK